MHSVLELYLQPKAIVLNVKNPTDFTKLIKLESGCWCLTPIILPTQEAEIRRIVVQILPWQILLKTLSQKNPSQKRACGVAQGVGPEFKLQYCK
jgi:hypothetical protein